MSLDKNITIAGLNYWRVQAQETLRGMVLENDIALVLDATDFQESESVEALGRKFQLCLKEFLLLFKAARCLSVYNQLLSTALETGYKKAGAVRGKGVDEFLKYVVERDTFVGLEAGGRKINDNNFVYWIKDMFLPLCQKREITKDEYAAISTDGYLRTKINYFLPEPNTWITEMISSPFFADKTEWRIYRKSSDANKLVNPTRVMVAAA